MKQQKFRSRGAMKRRFWRAVPLFRVMACVVVNTCLRRLEQAGRSGTNALNDRHRPAILVFQ